ncbi:hypothetical protein L21SP2_1142 [Salinispira pacifica]|uniref:Uncharacterized protein n=1 Tax=Salinispira pacifica TaxID=1307761 RepID=V5WG12_9SPIO|nr:hypothetical protein L21SP2_1142 [Salinispira pacifica]
MKSLTWHMGTRYCFKKENKEFFHENYDQIVMEKGSVEWKNVPI